ncbi:carbohydrate ABC transporter permease [Halorussus sp. AFM4]|uniref:carbohydrate ABC transporter permease n=1 Tax=Halorussus sp. AFM4 TaxID=3421651 RepID=UPI003EB72717
MIETSHKDRFVLYAGLTVFGVLALLPYLWIVRTSFLTNIAAISTDVPFIVLPGMESFSVQSFVEVWNNYDLVTYFKNSIFVSLSATVIALIVSIPGAYAFARRDFPGRKVIFYTAVFTVMFPSIVIFIPVYELFYWLNLVNTYAGLIIGLGVFVMPLSIWLLQGFFRQGIPANIEEAAKLDGLTDLTAFLRIVLPLSAPAVAVTALFAFLNAWNNFLWVYLLTSDSGKRTATVAIYYLTAGDTLRQWNQIMAVVVMLVLPPVLFYGLIQGRVGEGMAG